VNHQGANTEIEYVVSGRQSAFDEDGKQDDLECVRNDGEDHGGSKSRTRRDGDGVFGHGNANSSCVIILNPGTRVCADECLAIVPESM